jgi:hypothetical protein
MTKRFQTLLNFTDQKKNWKSKETMDFLKKSSFGNPFLSSGESHKSIKTLFKTPFYLTMSRLLILISAFLAVSAKTLYHQLDSYSFEDYVKEFNLSFSESELPTRRALFNSEIARIQAHNSKNLSWKEGVTKFTTMTAEEKKAFYGRSKGAATNHKNLKSSKALPSDFTLKPLSQLPKNVRNVPFLAACTNL